MRDLVLLWALLIGVGFGGLGWSAALAATRRYEAAVWPNMLGPALVLGDALYRILGDPSRARDMLHVWGIGLLLGLSLTASLLSMKLSRARVALFWIGWALNLIPVSLLVFGAIFGTILYLTVVPH